MPQEKKARAIGFNHIALEVGDIDEALAFYGRLFDFDLRGRSKTSAFIDLGDQFLALQRVHSAGSHLLSLINQALDLSKFEAGKLELSPESVSLAPLLDEVIGTARQLADQNKNRLKRYKLSWAHLRI